MSLPKSKLFSTRNFDPVDLDDVNVDNIVLTPEDEQNPELLAELAALNINNENEDEKKSLEISLPERITGLKSEILKLKRDGKIDEAKRKLQELIELEGKTVPKTLISSSPVKTSNNTINNNKATPKTINEKTTSTSPTDTQVYREMFAKLQKQSLLCQSIIEFYTVSNRKSDTNLFLKRKQALDLDLQKLRMMLKNKQPAPAHKTVNVTYEYMLTNQDVPEGEIKVQIGKLKIILPRKFKLKETEEYKIRLNYELSGLNEQEMNLISEPFTTQGLINSNITIN